MRAKILVILIVLVGLAGLAGCTVETSHEGMSARDPMREAGAQATRAAIQWADRQSQVDAEIKATSAAVAVSATATAVAVSAALVEQNGQTQATVTKTLSMAIAVVMIALAVAVVILALGRTVASVRQAWAAASYVHISVEPRTLLPPALIVTSDGYLIDTRTGERARLRDAAGVDRLRLAASTHTSEVALLTQGAANIAKSTRSGQAADALMAAAGSVPVLDVSEVMQ